MTKILLLVITVFVFLLLVFRLIFKAVTEYFKRNVSKEISRKFNSSEIRMIALNTNFLGIESKGAAQIRGNGSLVLTNEKLYFRMWVPKKEIEIPLYSVQSVGTVKSHLGKNIFRPLLKVTFINSEGTRDSAAWLVSDLDRWLVFLKPYEKTQ